MTVVVVVVAKVSRDHNHTISTVGGTPCVESGAYNGHCVRGSRRLAGVTWRRRRQGAVKWQPAWPTKVKSESLKVPWRYLSPHTTNPLQVNKKCNTLYCDILRGCVLYDFHDLVGHQLSWVPHHQFDKFTSQKQLFWAIITPGLTLQKGLSRWKMPNSVDFAS